MNVVQKTAAALILALATAGAGAASAEPFAVAHPRRAEVSERLHMEHARIEAARRTGRISPRKAAYLHRKVMKIGREARFEARKDHGVLTRHHFRKLNREEN